MHCSFIAIDLLMVGNRTRDFKTHAQ